MAQEAKRTAVAIHRAAQQPVDAKMVAAGHAYDRAPSVEARVGVLYAVRHTTRPCERFQLSAGSVTHCIDHHLRAPHKSM
jgi:hypothetical protein